MSHWKMKSEKNIRGADLLMDNDYLAASVHCA